MSLLALKINDIEITPPGGIPTGDVSTASDILGNLLGTLFAFGVLIVTFFIVWGGIMWITSQGDKQKVAAARNRIIYSIIGLTIIFFSVFIVNIILYFFGRPKI